MQPDPPAVFAAWEQFIGWLLNRKYTGTKLKARIPARPFVGLTRQGKKDIEHTIGVAIAEVRD